MFAADSLDESDGSSPTQRGDNEEGTREEAHSALCAGREVHSRPMQRAARTLPFVVIALSLVAPSIALADVIPPPSRPGWDSPPAPLPTPPELLVFLTAVLIVAVVSLARRRAVGAGEAAT